MKRIEKAQAAVEQAQAAMNRYLAGHPGYSGTVELETLHRQYKRAKANLAKAQTQA